MAWTAPITYVSGAVATAAGMNTYVKDDLAYLKSLLDGTGTGIQVTVPGVLSISNDPNYLHYVSAGLAVNLLDTNDYWYYDRAANTYNWDIAGGIMLTLAAGGKLTGAGFYDSGELSMAASATTSPAHGLGAKPRFVFGYWSATIGEVAGTAATGSIGLPGATVSLTSVSSTTIVVQNTAGATRYARVLAML